MSTKTFSSKIIGQDILAKFGWLDIARCRKELMHPVLKAHDLQEMIKKLEDSPEGEREQITREQKELILESGFETIDSMFRICQIGIMSADEEITEKAAADLLDRDPGLIGPIFHFFKERNWLYQDQTNYNPEEEDKKTKKKTSPVSA